MCPPYERSTADERLDIGSRARKYHGAVSTGPRVKLSAKAKANLLVADRQHPPGAR
jgi:hypothetical protein